MTDTAEPPQAPARAVLPPGWIWEIQPNGDWQAVKGGGLSRTIGFRVPAATYNELIPFCESFPSGNWADAFRWLITQEAVRDVISERVKAQTRHV